MAKQINLSQLTDEELLLYYKEALEEHTYCYGAQFARKISINSLYGALSNSFFRWFDSRLSESITKTGQLTIRWVERALNKHLNKVCGTEHVKYVIYCDTDSNYITLSNFVKKFIKDTDIQKIVDKLDLYCEKELQTVIDSSFKELTELFNHREQVLVMKRENIASRGFWTAKKRYALNVYDSEGTRYQEPELKVQGLESVKSSMPRAVRGLVSDALKVILNKNESELHEFIDKARQDFYARPFEEITYTKSTNNLAKYSSSATIYQKGCPINVRGALMYNHLIKTHGLQDKYELIGEGDKIKFVYLSMPNPTGQNVIAAPYDLPSEFGLDPYLDKRLQFNKAFVAPVQAMTDAIGWNIEPISNLDSLFDD